MLSAIGRLRSRTLFAHDAVSHSWSPTALDKARAKKTVARAFPISTALGIAATLAFYFAGGPLTGLFTDDPTVHAAATEYAMILAASQLFVSWEALSEGVLAGAGDTKTVFWWSAPFNILRIPLAWWFALPLGFGAVGIWWALNLTTIAKALGKGWSTWRGRWTEVDLDDQSTRPIGA